MKYDIFISYRREGGYDTAKHINDLLVRDGYKVSFDIDTLRNGDFDVQLLERIELCKDFILIVDRHAFDRTLDPEFDPKKDWLRCELAHALKHKKNIIPVFLSGVEGFPENLPDDIVGIVKKNGPEYNKYYFDEFYKTLKKRFLKSGNKKNIYIGLSCVMAIIIAVAGILIFGPDTEESLEYKPYDNPDAPHTTSIEQFDSFAEGHLRELLENSACKYPRQLYDSLSMRTKDKNAESIFNLGLCYYAGYGTEKDVSKAVELFMESGNVNALYSLGVCYNNGIEVEQNLQKATDYYYKAAQLGLPAAQNDYGVTCISGIKMAPQEAFDWFNKSAEQGYAPAQYNLAYCFANNLGVNANFDESVSWLEKAADQDYPIAILKLAQIYLFGPENYKDMDSGFKMLETLVEKNYVSAYYQLGSCYLNAIGVDKDIEKGLELVKKGAEKGDAVAMTDLGISYIRENFVEKDEEKGWEYLYMAAEQGFPVAQYVIGLFYKSGTGGVEQDLEKARMWFDLAAMQNVNSTNMQGYNYLINR